MVLRWQRKPPAHSLCPHTCKVGCLFGFLQPHYQPLILLFWRLSPTTSAPSSADTCAFQCRSTTNSCMLVIAFVSFSSRCAFTCFHIQIQFISAHSASSSHISHQIASLCFGPMHLSSTQPIVAILQTQKPCQFGTVIPRSFIHRRLLLLVL